MWLKGGSSLDYCVAPTHCIYTYIHSLAIDSEIEQLLLLFILLSQSQKILELFIFGNTTSKFTHTSKLIKVCPKLSLGN